MTRISLLAVIFAASCCSLALAQECKPVGDLGVFLDPSCPEVGAGCNAGGQGVKCRFCGFGAYPPCPAATSAPTKPQTTKATTKATTTKRPTSTSTKNPNPVTGNPNPNPNPNPQPQPEPEEAIFNEYGEKLIFSDEFDSFDLRTWRHDLTMSGGGNWEFQLYHNNRTNSFVKDGHLHIHPTLTEDRIGTDGLRTVRMDMWGMSIIE
jgi:hypothetical protein